LVYFDSCPLDLTTPFVDKYIWTVVPDHARPRKSQGVLPMLDRPTLAPRGRLVRLVEQLLAANSIIRSVDPEDGLTAIGLSSIDMVNLMLAVEAEFDVMIPQSDITPENFRSISAIEALIAKLVPQGAAR
jgi:acyl carrier protein